MARDIPLHEGEERYHRGIIPTRPDPAHRSLRTEGFQRGFRRAMTENAWIFEDNRYTRHSKIVTPCS